MSDNDICPTCKKPIKFSTDLVETLSTSGALDKIAQIISSKMETPAGFTPEILKEAIQGVHIEPPNVKITHHGVQDLLKCPQCQPDLDAFLAQKKIEWEKTVSQKPRAVIAAGSRRIAVQPKIESKGLFG